MYNPRITHVHKKDLLLNTLTGLSLARLAHGLVLLPVRPLAALSAVANPPAVAALEIVHILPILTAEAANTLVLDFNDGYAVVVRLEPPNVDSSRGA